METHDGARRRHEYFISPLNTPREKLQSSALNNARVLPDDFLRGMASRVFLQEANPSRKEGLMSGAVRHDVTRLKLMIQERRGP